VSGVAAVLMVGCGKDNPLDVPCDECPPLPEPAPPLPTQPCEQNGFTSPEDSGACPYGYDVPVVGAQGCCVPRQPCVTSSECHRVGETCSPDVSEGGTFCMPPQSDASSSDAGSDGISDAPSDGAVDAGDATLNAPADAGGQ
jgi:hypothetical protein